MGSFYFIELTLLKYHYYLENCKANPSNTFKHNKWQVVYVYVLFALQQMFYQAFVNIMQKEVNRETVRSFKNKRR